MYCITLNNPPNQEAGLFFSNFKEEETDIHKELPKVTDSHPDTLPRLCFKESIKSY